MQIQASMNLATRDSSLVQHLLEWQPIFPSVAIVANRLIVRTPSQSAR